MSRNRRAPREGLIELVEAAQLLAVGYYVAHNWALRGQFKAERIDGRWFADRADVERLCRERAQTEPRSVGHEGNAPAAQAGQAGG